MKFNHKTIIFSLILLYSVLVFSVLFSGCFENKKSSDTSQTRVLDITDYYSKSHYRNVYKNWDEIGNYTRNKPVSFTNKNGLTHYYEVVEIPDGDVEWLCAAYLAQISGGYLVCPETEEENEFVFSLIDDEVDWYTWGKTNVTNGPPIGGFQACDESHEEDPSAGWMWLSGEKWEYTNWCQNLDDGILDSDPRNNIQPNDVTGGNQDAICYGEITSRVSTWGDFPVRFGDLRGGEGATFYAFVIEYETNPK